MLRRFIITTITSRGPPAEVLSYLRGGVAKPKPGHDDDGRAQVVEEGCWSGAERDRAAGSSSRGHLLDHFGGIDG